VFLEAKMRKRALALAITLLVGAPLIAAGIGTPSALPAVVAVGSPTPVSITIALPDAAVVPGSVNLVRLNPPTQIIAQLRDDGQGGDAVAGDKIYSARITLLESVPTTVQLQVSVAFRGLLRRTVSPVFNVAVTPTGTVPLPADPGAAGMATLEGIDSDNDGVRDDVQRLIRLTFPSSQRTQSALTQLAKGYLAQIVHSSDPQLAHADSINSSYGIDCLFYVSPTTAYELLGILESQILNTLPRISAYLAAVDVQGSRFSRLPSGQEQKTRCAIDPDTLPN
jgi:hypothetical protein